MAVSPYVSRAELWLANSSFRPTFHLPNDFHPSVFLKWFPGHMAKGLLLSAVEIIFDNTEETIYKWQLIHCWYICYSFTYDATPITKMRLCNRSSWCENILFSAKICMIKVKRLYANLQYKGFHPTPLTSIKQSCLQIFPSRHCLCCTNPCSLTSLKFPFLEEILS